MKYDEEADVLITILEEKGELSRAKELGDIVVHFSENGKPLFMEILRASKIAPLMVESLTNKKEITIT
ncbi:MAG: DUF2283 domain-containing protein [Candidatus Bathyarchaeia archaeon]